MKLFADCTEAPDKFGPSLASMLSEWPMPGRLCDTVCWSHWFDFDAIGHTDEEVLNFAKGAARATGSNTLMFGVISHYGTSEIVAGFSKYEARPCIEFDLEFTNKQFARELNGSALIEGLDEQTYFHRTFSNSTKFQDSDSVSFRYSKLVGLWDKSHRWILIGGFEFEMAGVIGFDNDERLTKLGIGVCPEFDRETLDLWLKERHMNELQVASFRNGWRVVDPGSK